MDPFSSISSNTSFANRSVNRSLDSAALAVAAAEDETARAHARLEQQLADAEIANQEAVEREAAANKRESDLRARIVDLESQLADARAEADGSNAQLFSARSQFQRQHNDARAQIKMLQEKVKNATELAEMHESTAHALGQEISRLHGESAQQPDVTEPIKNQEVQELILENTRLEQQLSKAHSHIQDLKVIELVNETLDDDKKRLQAKVRHVNGLELENSQLKTKIESLESQRRVWAAFINASTEYTKPQHLTKQVAELQAHVAGLKKMLETSNKVIALQRAAAAEASVLHVKVNTLEKELEDSKELNEQLKIRIKTSQTHVQLLSEHLKEKEVDLSKYENTLNELDSKVQELQKSEGPKRKFEAPTSDPLDELATKLMETEKSAQNAIEQLEVTRKELKSAQAAPIAEAARAEVVSVKGSTYEKKLHERLDLVDALERENEALKSHLQHNEIRTVPLETIAVLNTKYETLKQEFEEGLAEKGRLLKGFKTKMYQTRLAELSILGYELELRSNSTCLVRSEYSIKGIDTSLDKSINFFEFVYDPSQNKYTDLSYTSSVKPYDELYKFWIEERKCLPAFLAAVLLQNYEKHSAN